MNNLYIYENQLLQEGYHGIVGTDEVGRGPMAGPLVAAAVLLPEGYRLEGINDSKKLSAKKRNSLFERLILEVKEYHVVFIDVEDVDFLNVYQASKQAMLGCVSQFQNKVDCVLTDAMPLEVPYLCIDLIKGDQKSASIAAASIIAKVMRDRYMEEMDLLYPEYGFKRHKGYVTKFHLEMLQKYGPCPIHRKSFEPVRQKCSQMTEEVCYKIK